MSENAMGHTDVAQKAKQERAKKTAKQILDATKSGGEMVSITRELSTPSAAIQTPALDELAALKSRIQEAYDAKPCMELYDALVHADQLRRSLVAAKL